jgi:glutamate synthase domain-containing protein 1
MAPSGAIFVEIAHVERNRAGVRNIMIFEWFDAKDAKAFGQEISDFYITRSKKTSDRKSEKFIEKKQRELLSKLSQKIAIFKSTKKLNIYKKAQISNVLKWRLHDAGFDKGYVDELTSWVTRQL